MGRPAQLKIVDNLKMLDLLADNLQYLEELKELHQKYLTESINDFRAQADQDGINELVRYLYWYSKLSANKIHELTDVRPSKMQHVAGPICFRATCRSCGSEFTARKTSRRGDYDRECSNCSNNQKIKAHRAFLVDWEEHDHVPEEIDRGDYSAYLNSQTWKKKRKIALKRAGYRCQVCSASQCRLDVHHNTYDRLGREDPEDLCVLCTYCHKKHHNLEQ